MTKAGRELATPENIVSMATSVILGNPLGTVTPLLVSLTKTFRSLKRTKDLLDERRVAVPEEHVPPGHFMYKWHTSLHSSSDDMEDYFARLLAGEFEKPGTFSRRTMSVLADMEVVDVKLFESLCNSVVITGGRQEFFFVNERFDMGRLVRMSLMETNELGYAVTRDNSWPAGFSFREMKLDNAELSSGFIDRMKNQRWKIKYFNNEGLVYTGKFLPIPTHQMTREGREMAKLVERREIVGLWSKVLKELQDCGCEMLPPP